MFVTVWKLVVDAEHAAECERHYGSDGTWVALLRKAPGYVRTELFRGAERAYITIDYWENADVCRDFRERYFAGYERLDAQMQALTEREEAIVTV